MQITHEPDENGVMRQIVPAAVLRDILDGSGEDYTRPKEFGPNDEWFVDGERD